MNAVAHIQRKRVFICTQVSFTYIYNRRFYAFVFFLLILGEVHKKVIPVKKYECSLCDFKFKDSVKFKIHLRSHTGDRRKWKWLHLLSF